jgi:hypothetical protein
MPVPPYVTGQLGHFLHASSVPWRSYHATAKSHSQQVRLFRGQGGGGRYPVTSFVAAVVTLQRVWRGILVRRRIVGVLRSWKGRASHPDADALPDLAHCSEAAKYFVRVAGAYDAILKDKLHQQTVVAQLEATVTEERRLANRAGPSNSADINAKLDAFTSQLQEEQELDALEFEEALSSLQERLWAVSSGAAKVRDIARRKYQVYYTAAATIQGVWLAFLKRKEGSRILTKSFLQATDGAAARSRRRVYLTRADAAAFTVQQIWRRYVQRRIFNFYVRAIKGSTGQAHSKVNPRGVKTQGFQLLKAVDYGEACMLMGASSDLHVRFRLAAVGENSFPPVVVYKVSSHAKVVDIGLFAPKDYVQEGKDKAAAKRKVALRHNKPFSPLSSAHVSAPAAASREDWYVREDRNPWRLVDNTAIKALMPGLTATLVQGSMLTAEQRAHMLTTQINPQTSREKLLRSVGGAGKAPVSLTSTVCYGATGVQRRKQEGWSVEATRRRWLAELYASEKVFQQRQVLEAKRKAPPSDEDIFPTPFATAVDLGPSQTHKMRTFHEHRAEANALFKTVPAEDVEAEMARLRQWSDGLDYAVYYTQWKSLGLAM